MDGLFGHVQGGKHGAITTPDQPETRDTHVSGCAPLTDLGVIANERCKNASASFAMSVFLSTCNYCRTAGRILMKFDI
jgi:hypothetical protein